MQSEEGVSIMHAVYFPGSLIFVDGAVENSSELIAELTNSTSDEVQVFTLNSDSDGIEQMSLILAQYAGVKSVHLVSHGSAGRLNVGATQLDSQSITGHKESISSWDNALADNADILIYGCDLAANDDGRALVESIGLYANADISASNDATGTEQLGGDWELEYSQGAIESVTLSSANWHGLLASTVDDTASFWVAETLSGNVLTGDGGTGINADTSDGGTLTLTQVEYDSVVYSAWDGDGNLTIDTTNGAIVFNQDGSYTYSPTLVGRDAAIGWQDLYDIYGFSLGTSYVDGSSNLDTTLADAYDFGDPQSTDPELYDSSRGLGLRFSYGDGVSTDDHIGDDGVNGGLTEAVVIDLGADARIFQVTTTYFSSSESATWVAYDALGVSVDTGTISGSPDGATGTLYHSNSVTVSGDFQYLVFTGDTSNASFDNFRIQSLSVIDDSPANLVFDYTAQDDINSAFGQLSFTYTDDNNLSSITFTGTEGEGDTLTTAGPTDSDTAPGTINYQWQRSGNGISNWANISGATSTSYILGGSDTGDYVRVVASFVDGEGTHETATSASSGQITGSNDAPTLGNNALTVNEGQSIILTAAVMSASDVDDNNDNLLFTVSGINNGEFQLVADDTTVTEFTQAQITAGDIKFVHDGSESAPSYSVTVEDEAGLSTTTAAASITFSNVDDPPIAGNETVGTDQDTVLNDAVPTPTDADGTINTTSYILISDVAEGALTFNNDGTYAFNPNGDFDDLASAATRDVTFTYTVDDNNGTTSNTATITITVTGTNDAPVAGSEGVGTDQDTILNDAVPVPTDIDGTINATSYALVADVAEGNLTFNNDGTYSFNPNGDFDDLASAATRDVTFTYTVDDNDGTTSNTATITITVTGTNDAPVAGNESVGTDQDTVLNDAVPVPTDIDGTINATSYALVADVAEGALTFNNDGTYAFNPNGDFDDLASAATRDVTFTYTVDDNNGATSNTATITITVTGANDAPIAGNESVGTDQDTILNDAAPVPTDVDHCPLLRG